MNKKHLDILPYLLAGLFVIIYVTVRVFTIPVTTDEAWTLYSFVRSPLWDIITIKDPSTNNHIFNTLLTKMTTMFSEKEFFLRLPNLLSLLLYVYGSYMLSKTLITNKILAFAMFAMLLTNFTLLDFFGLCRGYGLSIGLLTYSIALLVKVGKEPGTPSSKRLHAILFCATMAFYANIAVLHVMVAIILILSVILHQRLKDKPVLKRLRLPIAYSIVIGVLGGIKVLKQFMLGEIFYGGEKNFIDDTLATMMPDYAGHAFFYAHDVWIMNIAVSMLILAMLIPVILYPKSLRQSWLLIPWAILLFSMLMTNIQFYLLSVYLPINRIGLFFYPLMVLTIFTSLQLVYNNIKLIALVAGILLASFSTWRFVSEMSTDRMALWWIDMFSRQVVEDIVQDSKGEDKPKVFAFWPSDNSINYYISIYHADELTESPCCTRFDALDSPARYDYLYLQKGNNISSHGNFSVIKAYNVDSSFVLYRNDNNR